MRIVIDTNLLCSALIAPGGVADELYTAWRERRLSLVTSQQQLEEFRRVTRYPRVRRYIEPAAAGTMHNQLRRLAVFRTDLPVVEESRDPADNFLLAMAQVGDADFLVTGDKHDLLALGVFERTRIITARQLLERLGAKPQRKRGPKAKAVRRRRATRERSGR
jgi:uncharacterized protein